MQYSGQKRQSLRVRDLGARLLPSLPAFVKKTDIWIERLCRQRRRKWRPLGEGFPYGLQPLEMAIFMGVQGLTYTEFLHRIKVDIYAGVALFLLSTSHIVGWIVRRTFPYSGWELLWGSHVPAPTDPTSSLQRFG